MAMKPNGESVGQRLKYLFAGRKFVAAVSGSALLFGMRLGGMIDDVTGPVFMGAVTALWVTYAAAQGLADAFGGKR